MSISEIDAMRQIVAQIYTSDAGASLVGMDAAQAYRAAPNDLQWGGDVSDVYQFDNGSTSFILADVSGKGVMAAKQTALIKYALRAYASHGSTPEQCLQSLNTLYLETCRFEKRDSFATVFFGIIDPDRRVLMYASAGHEPAMVLNESGDTRLLESTGPVIGVVDRVHLFHQKAVALAPNDTLLAFTDGVTEARSLEGDFLGIAAVIDLAGSNAKKSADEQASLLLEAVENYCGARKPHDDIAILVLKVKDAATAGYSHVVG